MQSLFRGYHGGVGPNVKNCKVYNLWCRGGESGQFLTLRRKTIGYALVLSRSAGSQNEPETRKENMNSLSRTVTVSFIALCTLAASAQVSSTSTVTGPNGKTATRSTLRGGGNVQSTTTGPNGQSATRNVSRTPGATNATLTGPNGQSATRSTTYGGGNSQTTLTGRYGGTASRSVSGRGTGTVTATTTGPRGGTGTRTAIR